MIVTAVPLLRGTSFRSFVEIPFLIELRQASMSGTSPFLLSTILAKQPQRQYGKRSLSFLNVACRFVTATGSSFFDGKVEPTQKIDVVNVPREYPKLYSCWRSMKTSKKIFRVE